MELRKQMGLDQPLYEQYFVSLKGFFQLDFGDSVYDNQPVWFHIKKAFPLTLFLALSALFLACFWGIPCALLGAVYKRSLFDRFISCLSVCAFSSPVFFTAPLLIWCFAIYWPILPVSEQGSWDHYVLPSVSLAFPLGAAIAQMGRASILETLHQDFIRTARSKGLSRFHIYLKHAFKPALIPLITILGLQLAALLTGTIIVETIFDWPGLGLLLFQSITRRDYPIIQACVLFIALIYLLVNLCVDIAYGVVHPQMRESADHSVKK